MRIMNLLKKVSSHCLVVMVTHETNLANFFADRILVIKNGQIISDQNQENKGGEQISEDVNLYFISTYPLPVKLYLSVLLIPVL